MTTTGAVLTAAPLGMFVYAYLVYPGILRLLAPRQVPSNALPRAYRHEDADWPHITITIPVYNEERRIAAALEGALALDYPPDRRQVLVISDASTDRTDEIVRSYADRGVDLVRLSERRGKTAAENAAAAHARGEIIVNIDASVVVPRTSLRALIACFRDQRVGLASGRDVSISMHDSTVGGESGYVSYEMRVRALETRVDSVVGASGCFYAIRRELYEPAFPEDLSRDFASALIVRQRGYRGVSADAAVCLVPRALALRSELRRKVRTMARGIATLWHLRALMSVRKYGHFAFMLISHKLVRWLVYLTLPLALIGLTLLSVKEPIARFALFGVVSGIAGGALALAWRGRRPLPRLLNLAGFALAAAVAGLLAWITVLRRKRLALWEPTRRTA